METVQIVCVVAQGFLSLVTGIVLCIKPVRERIIGRRREEAEEREATKALLRNDIVEIYFHKREKAQLHQFEYENLFMLYDSYKKLGGNSFVDRIWEDIQSWEIVP